MKPWQHRYDINTGSVDTPAGYQHLAPYLNAWWAIYNRLVKPGVPEMVSAELPVFVLTTLPPLWIGFEIFAVLTLDTLTYLFLYKFFTKSVMQTYNYHYDFHNFTQPESVCLYSLK